jgi:hypothetical protein
VLDRPKIGTDIRIVVPTARVTGLRKVLRRSRYWKRRANREAQAALKARRRSARAIYQIELDGIGLDALQRWRGLTDSEIRNPRKVREALSEAWAEAAMSDLKKIR